MSSTQLSQCIQTDLLVMSPTQWSQFGCDVFHLDCSMPTFWVAYDCLGCLPAQDCCRLRSLGAWSLCHWSPDCRKVHKLLPNLLVHLLQHSHTTLVFDQLENGVPCRTHQLHWHHSWIWMHVTRMMAMLKGLAPSRTDMRLLELGQHPMTLFTISLRTRKPTPWSCFWSTLCDPHLLGFCLQNCSISYRTIQCSTCIDPSYAKAPPTCLLLLGS